MKQTTTIIAVCILNCLSAYASYDKDTLNALIWHDKEGRLEPEKTLELMEEYKEFNPRAGELLEFSKDHKKKCSFLNVQEMKFIVNFSPHDSETLKAFKEFLWFQRALACKESWKKDLEEAVETLTEVEKKQVDALREAIRSNFQEHQYNIKSSAFMDDIYSYYERNSVKSDAKADFDKLFVDLCDIYLKKLRAPTYLYEELKGHPETKVDADKFVRNYLENYDICELITKNKKTLKKGFTKLLKSKNPKTNLKDKLSNCFSGKC